MKIFHTSPQAITEIYESDVFGDVLFFADKPYYRLPSKFVYAIDIPDDEIWSQWQLFRSRDEDVVAAIERAAKEMAEELGIDFDRAEHILTDEDADYRDLDGWTVQSYIGKLAKYADISCIRSRDEQGTVYIVPMAGKVDQLTLVETHDDE